IGVGETDVITPTPTGPRTAVTVMKLAGVDGHLLWRRELPAWRAWPATSLALDAQGNPVVATSTNEPGGNDFGVFKLSGASGDVVWVARESGSPGQWQEAFQTTVLASGDVAAVGFTADASGKPTLTAVVLDAATGAERWRTLVRGSLGSGFG